MNDTVKPSEAYRRLVAVTRKHHDATDPKAEEDATNEMETLWPQLTESEQLAVRLFSSELNRMGKMQMGGVLSDRQIRELGIITPFHEAEHRPGVISYGVTSMGYDVRIAPEVRLIQAPEGVVIDPKNFNPRHAVILDPIKNTIILPAMSYALAHTMEYIRVPRRCLGIVVGKSTYARAGLVVNCTPMEPEWEGHLTLELYNPLDNPLKIYIGEGICQFVFIQTADTLGCETSYADKKGKYQGQAGVTLAKVL